MLSNQDAFAFRAIVSKDYPLTMRVTLLLLLSVAGILAVDKPRPKSSALLSFEGDGYQDWARSGEAFGLGPSVQMPDGNDGIVRGYAGDAFGSSGHGGASALGELRSPVLPIDRPYLSFLIAGASEGVGIELLVDGVSQLKATGRDDSLLRNVTWNLGKFSHQTMEIRLYDESRTGALLIDHIMSHDFGNPRFPATTRGGIAYEPGLIPSATLPGLQVAAGLTASIFADFERQGVMSPTALTVAEDGRLFIAETHRFRTGVRDNRDHLYWIMDDIASTSTEDRLKMYQKWQSEVPLTTYTGESEKVRVLIDHDGDGVADFSDIFADGFDEPLDGTASGIFAYEGTVYFACLPGIYALQDQDSDGKAETRVMLQDGFGTRVSFSGHDLNGFALGPDGRLYGTMGDRALNLTTREGIHYQLLNQGAAFRVEPDGSNFEIIHVGLRNAKEIAFNEYGDAFTVDNNADMGDRARVIGIVSGGDSGWRTDWQNLYSFNRQIGLSKRAPTPWMEERMWETRNSEQPAWMLPPIDYLASGPSGLAFQPGTALGGQESGRFFVCNYQGGPSASGVWSFGMERTGATYEVSEPNKFLWGVGVTDIEFGFNGTTYLTDFVDGWGSAPQGRILALDADEPHLAAQEVAILMAEGFDERNPEELAMLLSHPDQRVRLRAQFALERTPRAVAHLYGQLHLRDQLLDLPVENLLLPPLDFDDEFRVDNTPLSRIHATWGLANIARRHRDPFAIAALVGLLASDDAELRAQAAKSLAECSLKDPAALITALEDPSDRVAFFAALSLAKIGTRDAFAPLLSLAIRADQADDRNLRHAAVVGLSGCASADDLASLSGHALPQVRLAALLALRRLGDSAVQRFLFDFTPEVRREAIRIIHDYPIEGARPALMPVLDELLAKESQTTDEMIWRRLIYSAFRLGGPENAARLFVAANADFVPMRERREALRLLEQWTMPHPVDQSLGRHAPLSPRPLSDIRPLIQTQLGPLVVSDSPLLAESVALISKYQVAPNSLEEADIIALVNDGSISPTGRTAVLEMLAARDAVPFLPQLLQTLLKGEEEPAMLRLAALQALTEREPRVGFPYLIQSLRAPEQVLRQGAAALLADHPHPEIDLLLVAYLDQLREDNGSDRTIGLEMLASARRSTNPAVLGALEFYQETIAEDPLAHFLACLHGGDSKRGATLFSTHPTAQCARCHLADSRQFSDNMAGPHLAGIGSESPRYLLESLIKPSAKIAPGFAPITVMLSSGQELSGTLLERTEEHIDLISNGEAIRLITSDIVTSSDSVSPMPAMGSLLMKEDIRDLVAYLGTLTQPIPNKKPLAPEPKRYHPSTQPEQIAMADESTPTPAPADSTATSTSSGPPEGVDQAFWELGKAQYATCSACHQPEGQGITAAFPPLANSEWVVGPIENLVRIQLRGLQGPIEVAGETYNNVMAPLAYQTDEQIAAVLTYIRNSWGNEASPVEPETVAEWRVKEEGQTGMLTVADLIDPKTVVEETNPNVPRELAGAITATMPDAVGRIGFPWPVITILLLALTAVGTARFLLGKKG